MPLPGGIQRKVCFRPRGHAVSWMVNVVILGCTMTPTMKATLRTEAKCALDYHLIYSMILNFCDTLFVHRGTWQNG